jgi:hypothetical protein
VSKIVHIVRVRTADVAGSGATPTAIGIFFLSSFSFNAYHYNAHPHINTAVTATVEITAASELFDQAVNIRHIMTARPRP